MRHPRTRRRRQGGEKEAGWPCTNWQPRLLLLETLSVLFIHTGE